MCLGDSQPVVFSDRPDILNDNKRPLTTHSRPRRSEETREAADKMNTGAAFPD